MSNPKIASLILSLGLVLGVAACGDDDDAPAIDGGTIDVAPGIDSGFDGSIPPADAGPDAADDAAPE